MQTTGHGRSRKGIERKYNADLWLCRDTIGLYAIADGLGESRFGVEAATLALATLEEEVEARLGADDTATTVLREALEHTNAEVYALVERMGRIRHMGCSLTAVLMSDEALIVGHLGDTRAYLVRDGVLPLTRDHTLGAELVLSGQITEEVSWSSTHRHILTRAVGMASIASPSMAQYPMIKGDRLLLATNGVYRSKAGPRPMWKHLRGRSSQEAADRLVNAALAGDEGDDRSVVLIDLAGDLPTEADAIGHLAAHPAFADMPLAHLVELRAIGRRISVKGPTQLAQITQPLAAMFIVIQGAVEARDGEDSTHYGVGSVLGFSRLVRTAPAKADLWSEGPVELMAIDQKEFRSLALRRPWLGVRFLFELTTFLADHTDPI